MNSSLLKTVGLFLLLLVVIAVTFFSILKGSGAGGASKEEIEKIIADYIQNNPKLILESVSKYQQHASEEDNKKALASIKDKLNEVENDPTSPVAGNPKGDVVLVEFLDYSCGYCKKVLPSIIKFIEEDKNIKVVFKELPILGPNSELTAKAALAVHIISPNKYFAFHKKLMGGQVGGQESINTAAKELGIDVKAMEEKMKSPEIEKIIAKNRELASSIGIHGTPAFVVGGELVPGAVDFDTLKALVAKARDNKGGAKEAKDENPATEKK